MVGQTGWNRFRREGATWFLFPLPVLDAGQTEFFSKVMMYVEI